MQEPIELLGAPGSPYTRKMLALLRYRRIPYIVHWGGHMLAPDGYPTPKVRLLPTFYFRDAAGVREAVTDSTPIARRLEAAEQGRSAVPEDPVLAFLNDLVEDYADEWLTKAMFHFRWAHEADIANAGPLLVYWSQPTAKADDAQAFAASVSRRQIDRLYVVGSNPVTAATIENSYRRLVPLLDTLFATRGFVLGARPSTADFALYGQLTQLAIVEPTSAAITAGLSRRVRAWVDRLEDLSGLTPSPSDWLTREEAATMLKPLLAEIGRVYAPFLVANAEAVAAGRDVETVIDGARWTQPAFPYQAKCLAWLREAFAALSDGDRKAVRAIAEGAGCDALFAA